MSSLYTPDKSALKVVNTILKMDEIIEKSFHDVVALLSQETGYQSTKYGNKNGYWSIEVVQRILKDRVINVCQY